MLTATQAKELREAGLTAYNHNIDTSEEFYSKVVTTRTYQERLDTLKHVREAGISVCSGGIVGLGEEESDRIGMLLTLATLPQHPESVPINALVAVPNTRIGDKMIASGKSVTWLEMARMIATARIVFPKSMVRLSAGRMEFSEEAQAMFFACGANSIFTGAKLLTTPNAEEEDDAKMFEKFGLQGKAPFTTPLSPPVNATTTSSAAAANAEGQ